MDLGFGDRNHEIGQATARALMQGAEAQMQGMDSEMAQYDRLLDDEVSPFEGNPSWNYAFVWITQFSCRQNTLTSISLFVLPF